MDAGQGAPGFAFWGLFVACAVILLGYAAWMAWTERKR